MESGYLKTQKPKHTSLVISKKSSKEQPRFRERTGSFLNRGCAYQNRAFDSFRPAILSPKNHPNTHQGVGAVSDNHPTLVLTSKSLLVIIVFF
jgi:hypothetical protein